MTFLLLNQTFYPDVMATGQYLTEVAVRLAERGHEVTVVTSRRAYDDPARRFSKAESWRGVRVYRVGSTGFGKGAKWRRAADFASFLGLCSLRLVLLPRHDVVVALTSPPLISFLGAWLARVRRSRFVYWVMDFNPDEAIAAGWLRSGSMAARVLDWMSHFSLRQASRVITLDRFMRERIVGKGIAPEKVSVIPPWSHDDEVRFDPAGRERFRRDHRLEGEFLVMYSGNHSPCHPLDTLLEAARRLEADPGVVFCFIGGGSEWRKIQEKQRAETALAKPSAVNCEGSSAGANACSPVSAFGFSNVLCLPYQPLDQLAGSLSAADLHVVLMGDPFVGIVHPCKIYNVLSVAAPVLYIGPCPSHVSELLDSMDPDYPLAAVAHGDVDGVVQHIERLRRQAASSSGRAQCRAVSPFSKEALLPRLISELEAA